MASVLANHVESEGRERVERRGMLLLLSQCVLHCDIQIHEACRCIAWKLVRMRWKLRFDLEQQRQN